MTKFENQGFRENVPLDQLEVMYTRMLEHKCTLWEVTYTFKPKCFKNIMECRKKAMRLAAYQVYNTHPEMAILTHELHENGWSHVHGIVAYDPEEDSHQCLKPEYAPKNPLGRSTVYPCRVEPYRQVKSKTPFGDLYQDWDNHLEYIIKDQQLNKNKLITYNIIFSTELINLTAIKKVNIKSNIKDIKKELISKLEDVAYLENLISLLRVETDGLQKT